jgi:O-6-methylguanine DNA methyltransferase
MSFRFRFETLLEEVPIHFDLIWNDQGKLLRIQFCEEPYEPLSEDLPYGIAALVRELKCFLKQGEPLLPFHWSMADATQLTEFSLKVYEAVLKIPHGETRTYSWVAQKMGKPLAARAVGQALRRNPFMILVPCHRVVSDKSIGGFMGCTEPTDFELRFKNWLLEIERSFINPSFSFMPRSCSLQITSSG